MNMKRWVAAILTAVALVGTTIPAFAVSGGGTFKKYSFSDTSSNQDEEPAQDTNSAYANPTDFLNSMASLRRAIRLTARMLNGSAICSCAA